MPSAAVVEVDASEVGVSLASTSVEVDLNAIERVLLRVETIDGVVVENDRVEAI